MEIIANDICRFLYENNYNTEVFKNTDEYLRNLYYITAKGALDNRIGNLALATCIVNFDKMPSFERVSGAGNAYRLNGPNGEIIYLFADKTHNKNYSCRKASKSIANMLEEIVHNSDRFLDVFLEMEPDYRKYADSYTKDVRDKFLDYTSSKKRPELSRFRPHNVRIHYVDVRQYKANRLYRKYKKESPFTMKDAKELENIINIVSNVAFGGDEYKNWVLENIEKNPYTKKELEKTEYKTLIDDIINYNKGNLIKIQYEITTAFGVLMREIVKGCENKPEMPFYETSHTARQAVWFSLGLLYSFIMDFYCMSRLFKRYGTSGVTSPFDPPYAVYSIIYAGSSHINLYKTILENMGYIIENQWLCGFNEKSCVNLTNFGKFFHS